MECAAVTATNDPQWKSSTDRAVMLAVAVLLPAVCGFFVVRQLWPAAESTPQMPAPSAAVAGESPLFAMSKLRGQ